MSPPGGHVKGRCSALLRFASRSLRISPRKYMLYRWVCCSVMFLSSLFIISINTSDLIPFWWNSAAIGSSFRYRSGQKSRYRSKPFPILGFWMALTDGTTDAKSLGGYQIISNFVEAVMFQPEVIMNDTSMYSYHAFDDDKIRRRSVSVGLHKDLMNSDTSKPNRCTRTAFHRAYHPNCNIFHEIDILFDAGDGYLGYS